MRSVDTRAYSHFAIWTRCILILRSQGKVLSSDKFLQAGCPQHTWSMRYVYKSNVTINAYVTSPSGRWTNTTLASNILVFVISSSELLFVFRNGIIVPDTEMTSTCSSLLYLCIVRKIKKWLKMGYIKCFRRGNHKIIWFSLLRFSFHEYRGKKGP